MRLTKYLGWVGTDTVKKLGLQKLRRADPSMINSLSIICYRIKCGVSIKSFDLRLLLIVATF